MAVQTIKDEVVEGVRYQINRMDARVGGLVLARLISQLQKMAANSSETPTEGTGSEPAPEKLIQLLYLNLDETDAIFVQNKALACVGCYKQAGQDEVVLPVLKNSMLAIPELNTDIGTVLELTRLALCANLAPFFTKAGLEKLFSATADSSR